MSVVTGGGGGLEQCFAVIILEFYQKKIEPKQELWTVQTILIFKHSCFFLFKWYRQMYFIKKNVFIVIVFYLQRAPLWFNEPNLQYETKEKKKREEKKNAQYWRKPRPYHVVSMVIGVDVTMAGTRSIRSGGSAAAARELGCVLLGCETCRTKWNRKTRKRKKKKGFDHIQFCFYFSPTVQNLRWIFFVIDSLNWAESRRNHGKRSKYTL